MKTIIYNHLLFVCIHIGSPDEDISILTETLSINYYWIFMLMTIIREYIVCTYLVISLFMASEENADMSQIGN